MATQRHDRARAAYEAWHDSLTVDADADAPWHRLVRKHLGEELRGAQVLEIACGRGGFAAQLASGGAARVVAADFSETAVRKAAAHASARGLENLEARLGDIQRLDEGDATFDVVVSCETIEHVTHPARAVRELARVLKPGGRLLLTTPNYLGISGAYRLYRRLSGRPLDEEGQPISNLTLLPRTLWWVRRAGLRVEAVDGSGHYLPVPGRSSGPLRLSLSPRLDRALRFVAPHSLVAASKPGG